MDAFDLRDPFRELYPNLKRYTWRKCNPLKQARLDYFLVSNNKMSFAQKVAIQNSYRSDHARVILTISLSQIKKGRGLWTFNNSLLTDKQYVQTIKETIKKIKAQYMLPVYDVNHINIIPNVEIQFVIND